MPENNRDDINKDYVPAGVDLTQLEDLHPATRGRRFTMRAEVEGLEKQHKVARHRHFEIHCDEPPLLGGDDNYAQPLTYLAAAVGF